MLSLNYHFISKLSLKCRNSGWMLSLNYHFISKLSLNVGTQDGCCKMIQMFTIFSSISNLSICEKFVSFPQALHCTVFVPSKYFTNMLIPGAVWMNVLQWPTSCTRVHTVCEL